MNDRWLPADGEMAQRIRDHDWGTTALGPVEAWPQILKTTVRMLVSLNEPAALAWGNELILLYNDAYVDLYGGLGQAPALGVGVREARPEIWDQIGSDYEQVLNTGVTIRHENRLVPVIRHGQLEAFLWTYSFSPVLDDAAPRGVAGVLILAVRREETTAPMRASDERHLFLSSLSDALRPLSDVGEVRSEACRLVSEKLQADWVVYGQIDVDRDIVNIDAGYAVQGATSINGEQPLSAYAWALPSYMSGQTVVVSDAQTSDQIPPSQRPAMAALGMAALISAPLRKNGELVGALAVSQARPRIWTSAEVRLVEETAARIWDAIERGRAELTLKENEAHLRLLVGELQHRTRNLMGVVRSTAKRTLQNSATLAEFDRHFQARIDALARVQGLLSMLAGHDRVTFDQLIHSELEAMGMLEDSVSLAGPDGVRLRSSTVQILAMAVHELATNALKYGALGQPAARLSIEWTVAPDPATGSPWLHIDWHETGVEMSGFGRTVPRHGQGRALIERGLPYQLQARTTFDLAPDGLRCTLAVPISATQLADEI